MSKLPEFIGVIHLPALPGSPVASKPSSANTLEHAVDIALKEAKMLFQAGFGGVILENFGDSPFYKTSVPPETIASLAIIASEVKKIAPKKKLGINVLRNDARSALAIAAVTGADFIRVNVLSGVSATDQGLIEGTAAELLRERVRLHAESVMILADVHVKHAQALSSKDISLAIEEVSDRGGADGVIVSGATTGRSPTAEVLSEAIQAAKSNQIPLYIGSGATLENLPELLQNSVRIIVGSALRAQGKAGFPLESRRVFRFASEWRKQRSK